MSAVLKKYRVVSCVAFTSLAYAVLLDANTETSRQASGDGFSREQRLLALSFEKLRLRQYDDQVTGKQLHNELLAWRERNKESIQRMEAARRQAREKQLEKMRAEGYFAMSAEAPPNKENFNRDDFILRADAYIQKGMMALAEQAKAEERDARDLWAVWLEEPAMAAMYTDLLDAKQKRNKEKRQLSELAVLRQQEEEMANPIDLDTLAGEERIIEETRRRVLELVAVGPLVEGEEIRDRLGPDQEYLDKQLRKISKIRAAKARARVQARIKYHEDRLTGAE